MLLGFGRLSDQEVWLALFSFIESIEVGGNPFRLWTVPVYLTFLAEYVARCCPAEYRGTVNFLPNTSSFYGINIDSMYEWMKVKDKGTKTRYQWMRAGGTKVCR